VKIWRELSGGQKATSEQACRLLEQRLCGTGAGKNKSIVLMVDELDMLWTRKQVRQALYVYAERVRLELFHKQNDSST
jgi:Cdc6-like AAA superfamily ATPase